MGTDQRWSKVEKWAAWSGDRSDFLLLLEVVAEVSERIRDDYVAEKTKFTVAAVEQLEQGCTCDDEGGSLWHRKDHARAKAELEELRASALAAPPIEVTVSNRDGSVESISGSPADVARIVDAYDSESVAVAGVRFDHRSHIFIRMSKSNGVMLNVESRSIVWAKAAFGDLSKAIGRGARHAWMRQDGALSALGFLAAVPVAFAFVAFLDRIVDPTTPLSLGQRMLLAAWTALLTAWPLSSFAKRFLLPGFELSKDGASAPSRVRARWIWSAIVWCAGVVIPMFLSR